LNQLYSTFKWLNQFHWGPDFDYSLFIQKKCAFFQTKIIGERLDYVTNLFETQHFDLLYFSIYSLLLTFHHYNSLWENNDNFASYIWSRLYIKMHSSIGSNMPIQKEQHMSPKSKGPFKKYDQFPSQIWLIKFTIQT